ncbi:MAG: RhuM [Parcubacteria group bacterium GW2011_GWA2_40_23]|nr:MAG: RhuM [Parcubacteria group bacterium GW2011_GWA2_40_23]
MKNKSKQLVVYQTSSGSIELRGDFKAETIWATQAEIATIFGVTSQNITMHLKNIYKQKELVKRATCKESLQVQDEGNRRVERRIKEYNLDVVIAVGYRINSIIGTHFRQWATKILREHITKGYTMHRRRILRNYDSFMKAVGDIQALLPEQVAFDSKQALELVKEFASTWISLDAFDKEVLAPIGTTRRSVKLTGEELAIVIADFRAEMISKKEVSDIFAQERQWGSIAGIVGNVMQSFGGRELYQSVEEKAAHLLYFMVKNHPFADGNKRAGAFSFVWFLRKARAKKSSNINPSTLTALTLLIAESDPKKKNQMTALVTQLLK